MARRSPSRLLAGRAAAAAGMVLGCLLAPNARADEPTQSEATTSPDVYPEPAARPNLVLIGAGVTAGWYAAAFGMSYLWPDSPGASSLRIPVAGPYMALAKTGCSSTEPTCGTFTLVLRTILTGVSAVGQTGGVLAMVEGLFLPTASREQPRRHAKVSSQLFQIAPVAPTMIGDSLAGATSAPGNPTAGPAGRTTSDAGNTLANFGVTVFGTF